eukprot:scaffold3242_cov351-Prasinococcus_capsulatus_cf.AAC.7
MGSRGWPGGSNVPQQAGSLLTAAPAAGGLWAPESEEGAARVVDDGRGRGPGPAGTDPCRMVESVSPPPPRARPAAPGK